MFMPVQDDVFIFQLGIGTLQQGNNIHAFYGGMAALASGLLTERASLV
jgi:hypothetical protein